MIKPLILSQPQSDLLTSNATRNLFHSGKGGGKTHCMGTLSALLITNCPETFGQIAANTYMQLTDSTLVRIFEVWKVHFGWFEYRDGNGGNFVIDKKPPSHFEPHRGTFKTYSNKICFENGAIIFINSLDNYKAIDGRELGWCLLDETKDTKEVAVKEVIIDRLRCPLISRNTGKGFSWIDSDNKKAGEPANPLYVFTAPAKEQWLTDFFKLEDYRTEILAKIFDPEDYWSKRYGNRFAVIASSYHNQANLPPNYIQGLLDDLSPDQAELNVYGSPFGKTGAEYYVCYNAEIHVGDYGYQQGTLHLGFDFNVNPYMTARLWQFDLHLDKPTGWCIDEYLLASPKNTIEDVVDAFVRDYKHLIDGDVVHIYGDASGKNKQPLATVKNYFDVIARRFSNHNVRTKFCLLKQNPRHKTNYGQQGRRDFCNMLLKDHQYHLRFDRKCKKGNADYDFVLEDANGAKLKKKSKVNGVMCEPHGHASDADDSILCYIFGDWKKDKTKMISGNPGQNKWSN